MKWKFIQVLYYFTPALCIFNWQYFLLFLYEVIVQNEPGLLEEYGGHIKLNVSWAKSFLKRIDAKKMIPVPIKTDKK